MCSTEFVSWVLVIISDHHCPWINHCVGHKNHTSFILFLFSAVCGCTHACVIITCTLYRALNIVSILSFWWLLSFSILSSQEFQSIHFSVILRETFIHYRTAVTNSFFRWKLNPLKISSFTYFAKWRKPTHVLLERLITHFHSEFIANLFKASNMIS